jgi:hypothetical protein
MRAAVYDRFWHRQGGGERHRTLRFERGGPGLPEPVPVRVTDEHGALLAELTATPDFAERSALLG